MIYPQVVQHSRMAENRIQLFHGRDQIIENVHNLVEADSTKPLVIYGDSGCGKTSIMAKCASQVSISKFRKA